MCEKYIYQKTLASFSVVSECVRNAQKYSCPMTDTSQDIIVSCVDDTRHTHCYLSCVNECSDVSFARAQPMHETARNFNLTAKNSAKMVQIEPTNASARYHQRQK